MREGFVACQECNGTGSTEPDCKVCEGYRTVKARRAYAFGYKKADLEDLEDDGFALCPACDADACDMCFGEGTAPAEEQEQQFRRVLIQAKEGRIAPLIRRDHRGRIHLDDNCLLSIEAARAAKSAGLLTWFCSVFGDELSLTRAGECAYANLYRTD